METGDEQPAGAPLFLVQVRGIAAAGIHSTRTGPSSPASKGLENLRGSNPGTCGFSQPR